MILPSRLQLTMLFFFGIKYEIFITIVKKRRIEVIQNTDYRNDQRPGSTDIKNFILSPDLVGRDLKPRDYLVNGNAIEGLLLTMSGANHGRKFEDDFFVVDCQKVNDDIIEWAVSGMVTDIESTRSRLTKAGKPNKTNEPFFSQVDACLANPGKIPVAITEYEKMVSAVESALLIEIGGCTLKEFVVSGRSQVAIYGEKRKALIDLMCISGDRIIPFDFKHVANLSKAKADMRYQWWIQAMHYEAALKDEFPCHRIEKMTFIAMSKSESDLFMAQKFQIADKFIEDTRKKYHEIFYKFTAWDESGREIKGYFPDENIKPYLY